MPTPSSRVQAQVRRGLLPVFVRRGLLPRDGARAMGRWAHEGGFSVDRSVRIEATDRAGRERLLRYCARPPFALEQLHEFDAEHHVYDHDCECPVSTWRDGWLGPTAIPGVSFLGHPWQESGAPGRLATAAADRVGRRLPLVFRFPRPAVGR